MRSMPPPPPTQRGPSAMASLAEEWDQCLASTSIISTTVPGDGDGEGAESEIGSAAETAPGRFAVEVEASVPARARLRQGGVMRVSSLSTASMPCAAETGSMAAGSTLSSPRSLSAKSLASPTRDRCTTWRRRNLEHELQLARDELHEARLHASQLEAQLRSTQRELQRARHQLDVQKDRDDLLRDILHDRAASEEAVNSTFSSHRKGGAVCGAVCALFGRRQPTR
eukprot:gb/GFBE01035429.1/.p1 GENE.gb/GFBE01035429.1/~~gb/GFBE01035429.1/.p1  ORF type:complete len:226 (+),score=32.40 gb/GFBE01035429.1/:1-678(+)